MVSAASPNVVTQTSPRCAASHCNSSSCASFDTVKCSAPMP